MSRTCLGGLQPVFMGSVNLIPRALAFAPIKADLITRTRHIKGAAESPRAKAKAKLKAQQQNLPVVVDVIQQVLFVLGGFLYLGFFIVFFPRCLSHQQRAGVRSARSHCKELPMEHKTFIFCYLSQIMVDVHETLCTPLRSTFGQLLLPLLQLFEQLGLSHG